jgi:hypothetical protein
MRLIDNKKYITNDNISDKLYWGLASPRISYYSIFDGQGIDLHLLLHSNNLIEDLYNDINRE